MDQITLREEILNSLALLRRINRRKVLRAQKGTLPGEKKERTRGETPLGAYTKEQKNRRFGGD